MYNINYAMFIIYIVLFINVIECYSDKKTIHLFRNNLPPPPPPQKNKKEIRLDQREIITITLTSTSKH